MTDPAPLARIANASARRSLLSLLGPQLASADHAAPDHQPGYEPSALLLREERQDLNNVWKETLNDSAGVGAIAVSEKQNTQAIGPGQRTLEQDALLRKQLLGPASKSRHTGNQRQASNGKLNNRNQQRETRRKDDEISSEEEQGRSDLGRSSKRHKTDRLDRANKKVKPEVETFESMQIRAVSPSTNDVVKDEEAESLSTKTPSARPKSYLDELLEAKRSKQQKKRAKKQKAQV